MTRAFTSLYGHATALAERLLPESLLLLVARLGVASIFFLSGRSKVEGWFTITDGTFDLFRDRICAAFAATACRCLCRHDLGASFLRSAGAGAVHAGCGAWFVGYDVGDRNFRLSRCVADAFELGGAAVATDRQGRRRAVARPIFRGIWRTRAPRGSCIDLTYMEHFC
jgi:hypothetical protein